MILEKNIEEFLVWLPQALIHFAIMAAIVALVALVVGYLVAAVRHGPLAAGDMTYRILSAAAIDLVRISPRRIRAIAGLAVKESIRRRVWVVFVLFALVLMFAGWFLDPNSQDPAELYLGFVLWWANLLIIFLAIFLSTFSLPNEIKNRIIYTVVTKPVRSGEIVLGRILGFGAVCTGILLVMGVLSYVFVVRSLRHEHQIVAAEIDNGLGRTTSEQDHQHEFRVPLPGELGNQDAAELETWTDFASGHRHPISSEIVDGERVYRVGAREDLEIARVPFLAREEDFYMIERDGQPKRFAEGQKPGVSVGHEWGYRRFIEGNTPMAAVWVFRNVDEDRFGAASYSEGTIGVSNGVVTLSDGSFPTWAADGRITINGASYAVATRESDTELTLDDATVGDVAEGTSYRIAHGGLMIERTLRIFRTHKGIIDKGLTGNMFLRNPKTQLQSAPMPFTAREFVVDSEWVDREVASEGAEGRFVDLFDDLVSDEGELEVRIQCLDPGQYFGAARPDLYLRSDNKPFAWNFFKGYLGVWFQMVLMVSFGVMFSTFLSGPVAMLTTVGVLVLGLFTTSFIQPLTEAVIESDIKKMAGGGPIESTIRLVTQKGIMAELEDTAGTRAAKMADRALMYGMQGVASLMPDLSRFDDAHFVSQGYDVPRDLILQQATITAGFVLATFLAGFLFLRMREVAK